ncbi:polyprenyl synthetase family protein [Actinomadura viridis]|uniref:Geranylgeranyl diphosphate synthase type I n=1 Tax=Actinomadura viridis TaxID=58110 RepID=A0A931GHH0_9ACTN|nr:polyprenyl synthetase family protein [Actinomadura viridis]MBG6086867.1 geranylgeranyl diphosphate synthase type I [Actinomadura viridis]
MTTQTTQTTHTAPAGGPTPAREALDRVLERVEDRLRGHLDRERDQWATAVTGHTSAVIPVDAIADLVHAGGKRLRPNFCASGFLCAGGDPDDPVIVDAAAALELLHVFALIHDDVLDDSPLRRGKPTVHERYAAEHRAMGWRGEPRRFGEGVAILAGDLAYVLADTLTADFPAPAREIWGELRAEMIIGQFLDIRSAAAATADMRLARWIAVCKSGHYTIHRPLTLGAGLAGRPDLAPAFEGYGVALGEAFQLRDDLIDAFGVSATSGKPVGLDVDQHKMTPLLTVAVERDARVRALVDEGGDEGWDTARLRELLAETGVRAEIEAHIDGLVERACAALADAPIEEPWRRILTDMAHRVAHRES